MYYRDMFIVIPGQWDSYELKPKIDKAARVKSQEKKMVLLRTYTKNEKDIHTKPSHGHQWARENKVDQRVPSEEL
ncbi:hypothetical protein KUTeg_014862 [Tegillarca granosa]|uniref:Uncharacterized protein n=1 Tax=Tegillarca granosa TaxID=220873 RepID=A0ABQ9EUF6_TEGGR|nr:hypothetical protein KUTeg_014862 [Tegillarca granosa]